MVGRGIVFSCSSRNIEGAVRDDFVVVSFLNTQVQKKKHLILNILWRKRKIFDLHKAYLSHLCNTTTTDNHTGSPYQRSSESAPRQCSSGCPDARQNCGLEPTASWSGSSELCIQKQRAWSRSRWTCHCHSDR